jgi:hypothetical protein
MSTEPFRQDKMKDAFLVFGSQYFAHARYSSQMFYLPICTTLFHISIEMLLKAYLVQYKSSAELKKIGHNLNKLWKLFEQYKGDGQLSRFDRTIGELDKVELLRYPDAIVDQGYALHVSLGEPAMPFHLPGMEKTNNYYVNVSDLDAIATEIFAACNVNPIYYFNHAPSIFQTALPPNFRVSSS